MFSTAVTLNIVDHDAEGNFALFLADAQPLTISLMHIRF